MQLLSGSWFSNYLSLYFWVAPSLSLARLLEANLDSTESEGLEVLLHDKEIRELGSGMSITLVKEDLRIYEINALLVRDPVSENHEQFRNDFFFLKNTINIHIM